MEYNQKSSHWTPSNVECQTFTTFFPLMSDTQTKVWQFIMGTQGISGAFAGDGNEKGSKYMKHQPKTGKKCG